MAPNHFSSTRPLSIFTQCTIVQRWDGDTQVGLNGLGLKERRPDHTEIDTVVDAEDYGGALRDRFGIVLPGDDLDALLRLEPLPA